jgi:peptidoglycan/xylan/chitin deacetylase (PgdA/CDA1 family)
VWIHFLHRSGLLLWVSKRIAASSGILVLTLHRVLEDADFDQSDSPLGMMVRRRTFERFVEYLKKNFEVIALSGNSPNWSYRASRPRIAVTFDDGWMDTFGLAHPLLKKHQVPITVFVCPALAGLSSPFWPESVSRAWKAATQSPSARASFSVICTRAGLTGESDPGSPTGDGLEQFIAFVKDLPSKDRDLLVQQLRVFAGQQGMDKKISPLEASLTWEDTQALCSAGVQIGSHTQRHEILTRIPLDQAKLEIGDSKIAIESRLGVQCPIFAYPNGSWCPVVRELVEKHGYSHAFINAPGIWNQQTDPWLIPRTNLWEGSLTDAFGEFSSVAFEYSVIWRAFIADCRRRFHLQHTP